MRFNFRSGQSFLQLSTALNARLPLGHSRYMLETLWFIKM